MREEFLGQATLDLKDEILTQAGLRFTLPLQDMFYTPKAENGAIVRLKTEQSREVQGSIEVLVLPADPLADIAGYLMQNPANQLSVKSAAKKWWACCHDGDLKLYSTFGMVRESLQGMMQLRLMNARVSDKASPRNSDCPGSRFNVTHEKQSRAEMHRAEAHHGKAMGFPRGE